jgi:SulP family sulfate permease
VADAERHPGHERVPDVFVFRVESSLVYFNADHVRDSFFERLEARGPGLRLAVFFLGACPGVDRAGAEVLEELHHELSRRGMALRLAEAHGAVRETLKRAGFEERCGPVVAHQTVSDVVSGWRSGAPGEAVA